MQCRSGMRLQMQYLCTENIRPQDSGAAQLSNLQEPRSLIASDCIIGLRRLNQIEQIVICRIDGLMFARQRTEPNLCAVEVVDQDANIVRMENPPELQIARSGAYFLDLLAAGEKTKAAFQPKINDPGGQTIRFEQGAEENIAVEKNQHQRRRARAQASDSSTAASISSWLTFAFFSRTALSVV